MAIDLALVRRSEEQLATNQDLTQAIATLQTAEQDLSKQILTLAQPAPKTARVPPPKPPEPAAQ